MKKILFCNFFLLILVQFALAQEENREPRPYFETCESKDNPAVCADAKMLEMLYKTIKYPASARENGIEGTVLLSYIVHEDGTVSDLKVVKSLGYGCDEEALRTVKAIFEKIDWLGALENGIPKKTQMGLPVQFTLE